MQARRVLLSIRARPPARTPANRCAPDISQNLLSSSVVHGPGGKRAAAKTQKCNSHKKNARRRPPCAGLLRCCLSTQPAGLHSRLCASASTTCWATAARMASEGDLLRFAQLYVIYRWQTQGLSGPRALPHHSFSKALFALCRRIRTQLLA